MRYSGVQLIAYFVLLIFIDENFADTQTYNEGACASEDFVCSNGQCIKGSLHCNNRSDCFDHSDEDNCLTTCGSDEYRCLEGICISIDKRCNNYPDCRNGDDEESCDCRFDDFFCEDGNCVSYSSLCNGVQECRDGSDEKDCDFAPCPPTDFTCGDRSCISKALVCDGIDHCLGAEDELRCEKNCTPTQFKCVSGNKCIEGVYVCDGYPDCPDRSDEDCHKEFSNTSIIHDTSSLSKCEPGEKLCENGICIKKDFFCDGNSDCLDNSDEKHCKHENNSKMNYSGCRNDQFECLPGFCINRFEICNGYSDCPNGNDEKNCSRYRYHEEENVKLNLKVYPSEQIINERSDVVFQCRDEGSLRAKVRWMRGNDQPLPAGSHIDNGRLEIPNIQIEHSGNYVCEAEKFLHFPGSQITVQLTVEKSNQSWFTSKTCNQFEARCSNEECIFKHYICDGKIDCSDGSDEVRCGHHGCEPNEFRCINKQCVSKVWHCDGDKDCIDGSDEDNCSFATYNSPCTYGEFKCSSYNQCIPKSYHCDHENDCLDGSDEIGCSPVYIVKPPPPMIILDPGNALSLTCTTIGIPIPEVNWRLNWGHIPQKCSITSINGTGTLYCPDIKIEDQGAYSCEGINVMGFVIAVPDTILVVKNTSICSLGKFNLKAKKSEDCISCFCFGITNECGSANLFTYQIPASVDQYKVVPVEIRPKINILTDANFTETMSLKNDGIYIQGLNNGINKNTVIYFGLSEHFNGNQLKSYGGYLHYHIRYNDFGIYNEAPSVIMTGNDIKLFSTGSYISPNQEFRQKIRLSYGEWFKEDRRGSHLASREDIMMVLANINNILIKAQYDISSQLNVSITNVMLDSARTTGLDLTSFVEECHCPPGYSGLSCENCSPGYIRRKNGQWIGQCYEENTIPQICPPTYYGDPLRGIPCEACPCPFPSSQFGRTCHLDVDNISPKCDCPLGYEGKRCERCAESYHGNPLHGEECRSYEKCDLSGSLNSKPDPYTKRCQCKEYATGYKCNQCKANTFSLASTNQFGCINCFCMGTTNICVTSNWYRSEIRVSFTNSVQGFQLIGSNDRESTSIISGINVKPDTREIIFNDFPDRGSGDVYYWRLPTIFLGNQITAYGGNLKYIIRYVPSPGGLTSRNSAADVELISSNDITLLYYSREFSDPNIAKMFTVPLLEQYWQRSDGTKADREHLLMALADVEAIRIKATYTTHTNEAALSFVSLDIAEEFNTGKQRAIEVEKCSCPTGYQGLSCEDCAAGYTRAMEGLYLGICEPCKCNNHSNQCNPENGACENCADHTMGENCEICEFGYEGNATHGTQNDCKVKNGSIIPCYCNPLGSKSSSCIEGQCECKRNVVGPECNHCRISTFGLSQNHPDGCNECFCSGITNQCHESSLYIQQIPIFLYDSQHGFTLTDSSRREVITDNFKLNVSVNEIGYEYTIDRNKRLFWSLPSIFTGNKVKSYGGNLLLTLHIVAKQYSDCHKDQDIILIGNGIKLYWTSSENVTFESKMTYSVLLKETEWRHLSFNGLRVATRSDLMTVLANIDAILVRASYCDEMEATYISDISLDTAVEIFTGNPRATQVETCKCPTGYSGTSCETCASGYYRNLNDRSVSILGSCSPCSCNGNEQTCELDWSGHVKCNCHAQYTGKYCEDIADLTQSSIIISTTIPSSPIAIKIREPKIQIIKIGDSVRYHCSAKALYNEPVTVKWEKEGGYLPVGRGIDDSHGVLFIREVKVSDSGNYICHVTDGIHVKTEQVTLHVGDSASKQVININPLYLKAVEGDPAEFLCEVTTNSSQLLVEWIRSNGLMNPNATFTGGIFRIPSVTFHDTGEYKCIVRSRNGYNEKSAQLDVKVINNDPSHEPDIKLLISPLKWSGFSGDTVRLVCNTSKPAERIVWSRTDRLSLSTTATQNNGILIISNSVLNDSGWYICTAILSDGIEKSITTLVTIHPRHDMPIIFIEPQRQKVPQGSTATIQCRTENNETNIKWIKNRESILSSNVLAVGSTLRITNIQMSNRGVYTCQINRNEQDNIEASAIIEVEPREMPVLQIYPNQSQTVLEGGTTDFYCYAIAGIPTPEIKWTRQDGRSFNLNSKVISGGMLRINNVTNFDGGSYVCVAENSVGITSATVNLEVNSFPIIKISPQNGVLQLKSGNQLHLVCTAKGYPQPVVSWSKDYNQDSGEQPVINPYNTGTFGPSATIDINSVSREDEGIYVCKASNTAGVILDYVQLRVEDNINSVDYLEICRGDPSCYNNPSQIKPNQHSSLLVDRLSKIPSGGKVLIRCKLLYTQDKSIYLDWKREDGLPMPYGSTVSDGTLFIPNLKKDDSGNYTCFGIDTYGKQLFSAKSQLIVFDFPKVELRPIKQTVKPGESPYIQCIATGEQPLNVEWEAVGRLLPTSVSQSNGVLQFYGITFSDAGKYVCKAWNELGTAESVAEVIVEASTTPIVRVQASKNPVYTGDSVDLHCVTSGIVNPYYIWTKPYEISLPWNAKENGNILSLSNVIISNNGVYRCAIESEDGVIEDDITLEILDRESSFEEPYENSVVIKNAPLGKNIVLSCRDGLQPPVQYRWTKKNSSLPVKHEIHNNILNLIELDEDTAGIYSCIADNGEETIETFTRVIVTGLIPFFSQKPLSFIELPPLISANLQFNIEISFKPQNSNGILLYTGETPNGIGDFLLLGLENNFPVFKFDLGSGPTIIQADKNITLGDWHKIIIRRDRKEGVMIVDDIYSYQANSKGKKDGLDVPYPLYVGGIRDNIVISENAGANIGFKGCINRLVIGGKKINLINNMVMSQSITNCKICERLENPCLNGVCQESTAKDGYECLCNVGYSGNRCQIIKQSCKPDVCGDGICSETDDSYVCDCPIGKTGLNCELSQIIHTPKLRHPRSFLAYSRPKSLRRNG